MKSILYFMHIDWRWIKQRPHFIAEGLSASAKVDVVHEIMYNSKKQKRTKNRIANLNIKGIPHIPFCRYDFIFNINSFILNKIILRNKLRKADVVWFGHPIHYNKFKSRKGQTIVYDCMDDLLGFSLSERTKERYKRLEAALCKNADIVLASSLNLRNKLKERYGRNDIYLVNNAISLNLTEDVELPRKIEECFLDKKTKKMTYIGTISDWFDFVAMEKILSENKNLELLLFGPKEVEIPAHERITYCGILEHKYILKVMASSDALVMPFVLNDLILSVDPVKAYEYIYACKPVIMPRYGESEKFEDFIYLYSGVQELQDIASELSKGYLEAKRTKEECKAYAESNSWKSRVKQIKELLK